MFLSDPKINFLILIIFLCSTIVFFVFYTNVRRFLYILFKYIFLFTKRERFLYLRAFEPLSDKETAPEMGNDSMYMSLLNVIPVARLDSGRWGFP